MKFENTKDVMNEGLRLSIASSLLFECDKRDFTAHLFAQVREKLVNYTIRSATHAMFGRELWANLIGGDDWLCCLEPVTDRDELMSGKLAQVFGMTLWSDCYRSKDYFIPPQDILIFSDNSDGVIGAALLRVVSRESGLRPLNGDVLV